MAPKGLAPFSLVKSKPKLPETAFWVREGRPDEAALPPGRRQRGRADEIGRTHHHERMRFGDDGAIRASLHPFEGLSILKKSRRARQHHLSKPWRISDELHLFQIFFTQDVYLGAQLFSHSNYFFWFFHDDSSLLLSKSVLRCIRRENHTHKTLEIQ